MLSHGTNRWFVDAVINDSSGRETGQRRVRSFS
jgi:hypothetical protein